ncbi:unnamed protein product [Moneuplotes crassus]|uniref:Uncharacterized protein n=1 Tax=Euplotes crassus TaxID=5936 RepID=A0AAD1XF10_EUPCR|nr:unnamed protein product [Moneuplotes crassus]
MSTSPKEFGSPETAHADSSLETKLATYKQKLKILKKAYIEEQTAKEGFKKQILSLCNSNEKLQKDLEEMEVKYLKSYRSNQELHDQIIQEKTVSSGNRGSLYWGSKPTGESSPKKNSVESPTKEQNGEVLTLKINQLEKQIKYLEGKIEEKEHEVEEKQGEIRDTEDRLKEIDNEFRHYKHEFEAERGKLRKQFEAKRKELEVKLQEILKEKESFKEEQERIAKEKIQQILDSTEKEKQTLKERIEVLEKEINEKADEFLEQAVKMDEIKTELTISKENEVKLQNDNECQKDMIAAMQVILQKHEKENQQLAGKLMTVKQQIIDSCIFKTENRKYSGTRVTSFGKSQATLYFTEDDVGDNKTDPMFSLVLEYGSGKAFKVSMKNLTDFYLIEGTNQICFSWPENSWLKKSRTETFDSEESDAIVERYLQIMEQMDIPQETETSS